MSHTHQGYVIDKWVATSDIGIVPAIRIDYPNEPSRVRAESTNNVTPEPNQGLWFVQGQLSLFESLIADSRYDVIYVEEIVDGE